MGRRGADPLPYTVVIHARCHPALYANVSELIMDVNYDILSQCVSNSNLSPDHRGGGGAAGMSWK